MTRNILLLLLLLLAFVTRGIFHTQWHRPFIHDDVVNIMHEEILLEIVRQFARKDRQIVLEESREEKLVNGVVDAAQSSLTRAAPILVVLGRLVLVEAMSRRTVAFLKRTVDGDGVRPHDTILGSIITTSTAKIRQDTNQIAILANQAFRILGKASRTTQSRR